MSCGVWPLHAWLLNGLTTRCTQLRLWHEAFLRLVDVGIVQDSNSRGHFFCVAAEAMRQILIEQVRRQERQIRGGQRRRISLDAVHLAFDQLSEDLLALNEAMTQLARANVLVNVWNSMLTNGWSTRTRDFRLPACLT